MRIIGGALRGRTLKTLRGAKTRPTADQLRQTLFDVLGESIRGSLFLDAYAGSGSVGIEALSRGAREAVLIESSRAAIQVIRANVKNLELAGRARTVPLSVDRALERLDREGLRFDTVFVDPPYEKIEEYARTLSALDRLELLGPFAWVIVEHSKRLGLETRYGRLLQKKQLRRGDSRLSFYILDNNAGESELFH